MNHPPSGPPAVRSNSRKKRNLSESTSTNTSAENRKEPKSFDLNKEWNEED